MRINKSLIAYTPTTGSGSGSVTSVGFSATVPTGLASSISGSPITTSGTIALSLSFAAGYAIPTTIKQSNWDDAYTWVAAFPTQTGNSGRYLTTNGSALSWSAIAGTNVTGAAISTANDTNVQISASGNTSNALLRTLTLTAGWTGSLAVGRGGTGATTLTGVVIGNATSAMTAVSGTAGQFLRRNTANTAYEFRTLQGGDIAGSELTFANDTNVQMTLSGTPASSLLQPVSINLGWSGQLAVGRGGTGASTLTGVLIGNGTSAVTAVTGTAGQILRRNALNTAYEFVTAPLLSGSGVADRVAIWTSSTNLIDGPLSFISGEANFGNNKLVAGNVSSTLGSVMLQDNYSNGHFSNIGTMYSGGFLMLGYGVTPSTSSSTGFLSSVFVSGSPYTRSSIVVGEDIIFYTASAQSIAIGSPITMTERLKFSNSGNLGIGTSPLHKVDVGGIIGLSGIAFAQNSGNDQVVYDGSAQPAMYLGGTTNLRNAYNSATHYFQDKNGSVIFATINSTGLGIGISPSYKLDVNGSIGLNGTIAIGRTADYTYFYDGTASFPLALGNSTQPYNAYNNNEHYFYNRGQTTLYATLNSTGLGIGVAPTNKLSVNGNVNITGSILSGIWNGTTISVPYGGTGATTLTGVVIGNSTGAMTAVAGTSEQLLRRNTANTGYEFWTPTYLGNPFTAANQIIYSNSANAPLTLNPNGTANNLFLRSVSSGSPSWAAVTGSDITGAALTKVDDTNVTMTLGGTPTTSLLRAASMTLGWTGQLSVSRGGTGASTLTGVVIGNSTGAMTAVTGTANQLLRRNALNTAYEFWTPTYMNNPFTTGGDLVVSNSAGAPLRLPPNVTTTRKYLSQIGDGTFVTSTTWETVAGGGGLSGSGTANTIAKWTGTSTLNNSIITDNGTTVTVSGLFQTITSQAGPGTALIYTANTDTTAAVTHQSRFGTQQLGAGLGRTLIYAASNTTGVTQGELAILSENGGSVLANFGTMFATTNYALSLFNTSGTENIRLHTQGTTFIDGGDVRFGTSGFYYDSVNKRLGIGVATPSQALDVSSNFGIAKITSAVGTNATFFQFVNTGGNFFIGSEGSTGATFGATPYASVIRTPDTVPLEIFQGAFKAVELLTTGQFKWNDYLTSTSFSGTAAGYLAFTSTGSIITVPVPSGGGAPLYRIDFNTTMPDTWTNMPSAISFFDGSNAYITAAELTNFTQVRLLINKLGTAGASGSIIILRYNTTYTQNANLWSAIGTTSVQLAVNNTNQFLETAWIDLVAGAKADVFIALMGSGGDGALDPIFGMITAEFR